MQPPTSQRVEVSPAVAEVPEVPAVLDGWTVMWLPLGTPAVPAQAACRL